MPRIDASQINRYKGILGWYSFTARDGTFRPQLEIELFIKDHPLPIRRPKFTEVTTISQRTPTAARYETGTGMIFFGLPDPLQLTLSGWLITPKAGTTWDPKDASGDSLNWGNMTYAEIISAYLSGKADATSGGAYVRRDPDYYISPYGHVYSKPVISIWEPQYTVNMRKQPFNMTLVLET